MRYFILPYKQGSKGAKALAAALGGRVLKLEGSRANLSGATVINWGNTANPPLPVGPFELINPPSELRAASNKLLFFRKMQQTNPTLIPDFWENQEDIPDDAFPIVCRTVLAGHSGDGIVIANTRDDLVACSLYVRYVKKSQEYRVHVGMRGPDTGYPHSEGDPYPEVIAVQRKARRHDVPNPDWRVRNHQNGFIYARTGFTAPDSVLAAAKAALQAVGLTFGAVDVIWNQQQERPYVLEINTAPGLEGQTVEDYAAFFRGT
jgi:hypothetical protein